MATDGLNSVYGKREGSGQAYILPTNQSIGIFANGLANQQERQRLLDAAALKRQQELQDANAKTLSALSIGDHWNQRSSELQKDFNSLTDYALKATQQGLNLQSDRDFLQRKNDLFIKAGATKEMQKYYEDNYKDVGSNPDKYENGIQILDSFKNATIDDFTSGKFKPERLKQIYSLSDAVKDSNGTISYVKNNDGTLDTTRVNRSGNVGQAIASLDTPAAKYLLEKSGGDTGMYKAGFPIVTAEGKTFYNTKGKAFEDVVINKLATDPNLPAYLQQKGYDVSSNDAIYKSALDFAKKQNEATGTYVKGYADNLEDKATTDTTKVFTLAAERRAQRDQQIQEETFANTKSKWADEALAASPDDIVTNVVTNLAGQSYKTTLDAKGNPTKTIESNMRTSTSLSAANVGNAKTPFLPTIIYDPQTGEGKQNASPITVSGGQVHIKPMLYYKGAQRVMDDASLKKLREGKYRLNGQNVPKNTEVSYDELLLGDERVAADPNDIMSKATVRKVMIPITDQALDKKFDKQYDRPQMWEKAIRATSDFETKKAIIKSQIKRQAPGMDVKELDKLAFETAKQY